MRRLDVLILYGSNATFTGTVIEHLRSYARYSRHRVAFCSIAPFKEECFPALDAFDVVVLHYSFFPGLAWTVPAALERRIAQFEGRKILYLQDEYDHTEAARQWMERFGIHCLYTCVPQDSISKIYPASRFPKTDFRTTLTGYVPDDMTQRVRPRSLKERSIVIGYRGRLLHPRYGDLAREKYLIGARMLELCRARGIPVDIAWTEDKRIYGDRWYEFLASCRATLGTESGSNVFDPDGTLRKKIDAELAANSDVTYEELHRRYLGDIDGAVEMNQISPRVFEAISTRTALVLFEGRYSGVLSPDRHYIPLRKDFSNVDDVFRALQDLPSLEAMVDRAYADVIESGKYSYKAFIAEFDEYVAGSPGSRRAAKSPQVLAIPPDRELAGLRLSPCSLTDQPIKNEWLHVGPLTRLSDWAARQTARARRVASRVRGR